MRDAFICDGYRTPIGRYGGALSGIRTDDLAAIPIQELIAKNSNVDWTQLDDLYYGCANQAGEDNRNVARMAVLLSDLPHTVPAATINRLCASGMEAVGQAARAINVGAAHLTIGGGVESMSRAPFVIPKASGAFDRNAEIYDTTIGWRFVNKKIADQYGIDSMPETAENLAEEHKVSREDADAYAFRSQQRAAKRADLGDIVPVAIKDKVVDRDEHPRPDTTMEGLAKLRPLRPDGAITAGNSSGVNDGACALLLASEEGLKEHGLTPKARVLGLASAAVEPRVMGIGPVPATQKVLAQVGLSLDQMDVIEINEAFAAQVLAVTRALGLPDDAEHVNPNGGAIALGHPLGMTGARLVLDAVNELQWRQGRYALVTLCVGVGQGTAMVLERV